MIRFVIWCFCVLTLISGIFCEIIPQMECSSDESVNCEIHEARLSPCKETPHPCKLKKKTTGKLEVLYTPKIKADNLEANLYWSGELMDVPLPGMNHTACLTTTCPTKENEQQTYTYDLTIQKFFPSSTYNVKFTLEEKDSKNFKCCMQFAIRICN